MSPGTSATAEWKLYRKLYKSGKLCREWQSFVTYYNDTGDIPHGYTLKRYSSRRAWSKDNCYWGKVRRNPQRDTWASILPLHSMTGK